MGVAEADNRDAVPEQRGYHNQWRSTWHHKSRQ